MASEPERLTLSPKQVDLMDDVLAKAPPHVREAATRVARGEVVADEVAEEVVDALAAAMLDDEGFDGQELTPRGIEIDGLIGIVQQMSEHFYD
jgi:hypothetical protein